MSLATLIIAGWMLCQSVPDSGCPAIERTFAEILRTHGPPDLSARTSLEGIIMRETRITLPELGLIAGTRAAAGAGLGLLLANRLSPEQRRAVGWTLLLVGAISTIPLALEVFGRRRLSSVGEERQRLEGRPLEEVIEQWREETALTGL